MPLRLAGCSPHAPEKAPLLAGPTTPKALFCRFLLCWVYGLYNQNVGMPGCWAHPTPERDIAKRAGSAEPHKDLAEDVSRV